MIGKRFGKFTVIKQARKRSKKKERLWICQCECGNFHYVTTYHLTSGTVQSCGCTQRYRVYGRKYKRGEAAFNRLFKRYIHGAQRRGLIFDLSKGDFKILTKLPCHYCGREPNLKIEPGKYNGSYLYNGIDRIDNNKGYEIDNCITCCQQCNWSKRDMSYKDFMKWVDALLNNRGGKRKSVL